MYHVSSQPGAPAPPHSRPTQYRSASKGSTQSLDLTEFNAPSFETAAFAGLDQIDLDWQSSWPHTTILSTPVLADTTVNYFQGFPSDGYYNRNGPELLQSEQRYFTPLETTNSSPTHVSMDNSTGYGDDGWYETLAQIKKISFLVHGIRRDQEKRPLVPLLPTERQENSDSLRLPPLVGTVMDLEHSVRSQKEQSDKQGLARLSSLFKGYFKVRQLLPPRQACKKLVSAYFETFGSVLCFLDTTKFFNDFDCFWEAESASQYLMTDQDGIFAHKLLVVLALGSVTCSGGPGSDDEEAERTRQTSRQNHAIVCVQHTREWLAEKMARGVRDNLEDIAQILCLLALARNTPLHVDPLRRRPNADGAFILSGDHDLARLGMQMGLHRESRTPCLENPAKEAEAEMRRRLWATMLELSLHQYLDAELPPPLNAESYNSANPSSNALEDDPRSYLVQDDQRVPGSSILAALSRTQRLRLKILQQLNAPGADINLQERQNLATELNRACNVEMNAFSSSGTRQPTSFQLWFFNALARPFVLALSAPCRDDAKNRFASFYSRRLRMETATLMLRPQLHDRGLSLQQVQTPIRSGSAASRSKSSIGAATYPFLPTPSTVEPYNRNIEKHEDIYKAACTALCVGGPSYHAVIHRQMIATLCADVITEIQDDMFPTLDLFMLRHMASILEDVVNEFRIQVRVSGGTHGCRELILFAVSHSIVVSLLKRSSTRKVNDSIMSSLWMALHHCCKAMGEQPEGFLDVDWELEAMEAATEAPRDTAGGSTADGDGDMDAQMQMVDLVLEQQDDVQRQEAGAADAEIAEIWAFDDEDSYFPVEISL